MYVIFQLIDEMTKGRQPFVHRLTKASKDVLDEQIKAALFDGGINQTFLNMQEEARKMIESLDI